MGAGPRFAAGCLNAPAGSSASRGGGDRAERSSRMDELMEPPRIQPGDVLAIVLEDLRLAAAVAALTAEGFGRWFASAVDLLSSVPDHAQRVSWAYGLVQSLSGGAEWRVVVLGDLMRFAEEVRRCRMTL